MWVYTKENIIKRTFIKYFLIITKNKTLKKLELEGLVNSIVWSAFAICSWFRFGPWYPWTLAGEFCWLWPPTAHPSKKIEQTSPYTFHEVIKISLINLVTYVLRNSQCLLYTFTLLIDNYKWYVLYLGMIFTFFFLRFYGCELFIYFLF